MKILMVGNLGPDYVEHNWVQVISKKYDVLFIDNTVLGNIFRNTSRGLEKYIYILLNENKFDYLFLYSDGMHNQLDDEFYENIRSTGIKIITFHADDEPNKWYEKNKKYDERFELIASHSKRGTELRKKVLSNAKSIYLPWGYTPELFYKKLNTEKIYDVVYIGFNKNIDNEYIEDGNSRQYILEKTYEYCKENNINFKVFGFGWDKHPILRECYGGPLETAQMNDIYNQSKIVFNPGYSMDDTIDTYQTKLRHFEVAGSGTFQISNYNPELEEIFGDSIGFYSDEKELFIQIQYYLNNSEIRIQKENKMHEVAVNSCTMEHRIDKLINTANNVFNINTTYKKDKKRVKTIYLRNEYEVDKELSFLKNNPQAYDEYMRVHYIAGNINIKKIDYSLVNSYIDIYDDEIIEIKSFIELCNLASTNYHKGVGSIIGKKIENNKTLEEYSKNIIEAVNGFYNSDRFSPLMNYLIKPNLCRVFLECYRGNESNRIEDMKSIKSSKFVNIVSLKHEISIKLARSNRQYMRRLKEVLDDKRYKNKTIGIYGAKGEMADSVKQFLVENQHLNVWGFVDKSIVNGKIEVENEYGELNVYNVYSYETFIKNAPNIVIIAAEYSGEKIYESIKKIETSSIILPLYNMDDPIWEILI